jgi:hypothetical protein
MFNAPTGSLVVECAAELDKHDLPPDRKRSSGGRPHSVRWKGCNRSRAELRHGRLHVHHGGKHQLLIQSNPTDFSSRAGGNALAAESHSNRERARATAVYEASVRVQRVQFLPSREYQAVTALFGRPDRGHLDQRRPPLRA